MLFGLSLSKALIVFTVAFLLFGVPLMTLVVILVERHRPFKRQRRESKNG